MRGWTATSASWATSSSRAPPTPTPRSDAGAAARRGCSMVPVPPGRAGRMRAFEAIAETLARLGCDTAFGVLGSGTFRLVERLPSRHGGDYHWARQETAAVTMADAWARVTGRVGVCSVHQGPG